MQIICYINKKNADKNKFIDIINIKIFKSISKNVIKQLKMWQKVCETINVNYHVMHTSI